MNICKVVQRKVTSVPYLRSKNFQVADLLDTSLENSLDFKLS